MFIINTNKRILIKSLQHFTLLCMKVNLATKNKTLYETLGVAPNATYNEIKSAYYALTLKYHPDKNKSESAKAIFQEISNAYDVLSKYQTRTQYDRTLKIKQHDSHNHSWKELKRHQSQHRVKYTKTMEKIYDFDTWLEEHYSYTFKKNLERKAEELKYNKPRNPKESHSTVVTLTVVSGIISILISLMYVYDTIKEKWEPNPKIVKRKE